MKSAKLNFFTIVVFLFVVLCALTSCGSNKHEGTIPKGGMYISNQSSEIRYNAGDKFPAVSFENDQYFFGGYEYTFKSSSWRIKVLSKEQSQYSDIISSINGYNITSISNLFEGCELLTTAPKIPNTVTNMSSAFSGCTSLTSVPKIPNSVTNMSSTFSGCTSLTSAPEIPNSVTNMSSTFSGCTSLTSAPEIPNSVTNMSSTFSGCTSLTSASEIPNSVTDMSSTFSGCTSLTSAPKIPNSVTNMSSTFSGCISLISAPEIPASVTNISKIFLNCRNLRGTLVVHAECQDSNTEDLLETMWRILAEIEESGQYTTSDMLTFLSCQTRYEKSAYFNALTGTNITEIGGSCSAKFKLNLLATEKLGELLYENQEED